MDGMTSTPVNPAPAPAPAPAPVPAPSPAPMQAQMVPSQPTGSRITDVLKRMNMLEIGFGIVGAAALYFTIYYYRYSMTMSKGVTQKLQNKLDELEIKVSDVQSALERDKVSASSSQTFM